MSAYLYTLINKEQLNEILDSFYQCFYIPIQILDEQGQILQSHGKTTSFCSLFKRKLSLTDTCSKVHTNAAKTAMELGEPYIFACHANLNHIVLPLIHQDKLLGSVLAGPFLMDEADSVLIEDIAKKYAFSTSELLELYDESKALQIISPGKVTALSKMMYYMFSGLISDSKQLLFINQNKLHQQSRINESIQMYKTSGSPVVNSYPYEKEKLLISKLKTGDIDATKAALNDLLGYVFFSQGNNLEIVKSRSLELCSLLSRAAIESGATGDHILKINNQLLTVIPTIHDIDTLCYKLQEAIDAFNSCMFDHVSNANSDVIKKSIHFISKNYAENLTLDLLANHVHLNPTYFSTIFKQSMGSSFKEYLNMVRVEESKRLLSNTNYSLIDIAVATGFEDQSYFTKVFKKHTGITPKQFRKNFS